MPETVTVASKLPHGLVLQLEESYEDHEAVMGGGSRKVKRNRKVGKTITINGCAHHVDRPFDVSLSHGYALTFGVDADFWKAWLAQKKNFPAVEKGLIWALGDAASVEDKAKEMASIKSGFEPVDPDSLPEEFRGRVEKGKV